MKKNIRVFQTQSEYDTFISGDDVLRPNVSYVRGENEVHYNPKPDYSKQYLTFEALESGTFTLSGEAVDYSVDGGTTWTTLEANTATPTLNQGDKILWKGTFDCNGKVFTSTCRFNAMGNIMSLMYGDNFVGQTTIPNSYKFLNGVFKNNTRLVSAENLILPAITLPQYCYCGMFNGCTALTTAPELNATTLATQCCYSMFEGCTALTTAPSELPATTLAQNCYESMFKSCTSLTTAPELNATTLAPNCYSSMFNGCTSLTTAPTLPATTLVISCYQRMFQTCTSLTTAPELPATTLAQSCYSNMFKDCTSLTTAPVLPATTLAQNCYLDMFNGCRALTTAPELNATTLVISCYQRMFQTCTSLTTAPELPATTLVQNCYLNMFLNCTSLNSITMLATDISAANCLNGWVENVQTTSGTFTKAASMTTLPTGASGIPSGWTVVDA